MCLPEFQSLLISWLGIREPAIICDIGCGTGALLRSLVQRTKNSGVGIDRDPRLLRVARLLARQNTQIDFQCGDAQRLPLVTASCDATIAFGVLQVIADADTAISEMCRITRPGGRILVALPVEEVPIPTHPAVATLDAKIAHTEHKLWSLLLEMAPVFEATPTSATAACIFASMKQRSATTPLVRGLFLPCSEEGMDATELDRYLRRMTRERARWAARIATKTGFDPQALAELLAMYEQRRDQLLLSRHSGLTGSLWTSPPLLVFIASLPLLP
ncbi:MAG: methyltransferase domain-containing protein [Phycisphaerae bacterium]|nr:class I SAM-dependent methyltransferase [Planctomycetia bacterium]MCL4719407.1 methyltransferase domain-containing protein [Phycisphaerae bacterium]